MSRPQRKGKLSNTFVETLKPLPNGRERIVRDGFIPGLLMRAGRRKKSWELRIEKKNRKFSRHLGVYPDMKQEAAYAAAFDMLARFERKEPLEGPRRGEETIATAWPLYEQRLKDDQASQATIDWYGFAVARLSEEVKYTPLKDLAADPTIIAREVDRIRRKLHNSKRGGQSAASAVARAVRAIFRFMQKRDPALLGDPVSAVRTADPKRQDLPVLGSKDLPGWWKSVQEIENSIKREAHVFCLLSGLRRDSLATLQWEHLDRVKGSIRVPSPKGGVERGFDLILSQPMLRCLDRVREAGRTLFPEQATRWVFPSEGGHLRGDSLTKDGVAANHALRRTFATLAREAGVEEDIIGRLLNHSHTSVTRHYIKDSRLGALHLAAQEDISAHIIRAIGPNSGL